MAEIGTEVHRFSSAKHLASWAGMCPGNHESAGTRLSGKTRKGSLWLRQLLIEAAHAASRTTTYLGAQYHQLAVRRSAKKAVFAVAHSILTIIYHVLSRRQPYSDLGSTYYEDQDRLVVGRRLVHWLERLGYQVSLQPSSIA